MNNIRPLIATPSPRRIQQVQDAFNTIRAPKLYVKFYRKPKAMDIIQKFFLDHKEFTHLAIKPDDLVSDNKHYQILKETLEEHDYPVLGGLCNANIRDEGVYKLGICENQLPTVARSGRFFDKVDIRELPEIIERQKSKIIQVKFAGLPFMFIRRDIVEQVGLESDAAGNNIPKIPGTRLYDKSGSYDVVFCNKCFKEKIPIHVHTDVKMLHLKFANEANKYYFGMPPKVIFEDEDKVQTDYTLTYDPESANQKYDNLRTKRLLMYNRRVNRR